MENRDEVTEQTGSPGEKIRAMRKHEGLTLNELSVRTGLAVSTLSKLEKGKVSLSYDKLMLLSKGLGVEVAQLLDSTPHAAVMPSRGGRRVVHRAGEGQIVETHSYRQVYLATELLNKQFTPLLGELRARTMEAFFAEFGDFIRHPGEEFVLVLEGVVEFHTEAYAPLKLEAGDSVYFDSEMGHAYLKGSDEPCRIVAICSPRGTDTDIPDAMAAAAEKRNLIASTEAAAHLPPLKVRRAR